MASDNGVLDTVRPMVGLTVGNGLGTSLASVPPSTAVGVGCTTRYS